MEEVEDIDSKKAEENEEKGYTNKIDMWALGVILYQLLTLTRPFNSILAIIDVKFISLGANVNKELRDIVNNLLIADPTKRYSAEEILSKNQHHQILLLILNPFRNANHKEGAGKARTVDFSQQRYCSK